MSGGYFDYRNDMVKSEIFGYNDTFTNVFEDREISELIWDVFDLIHDFDWYKSCDTSKVDYLNAKDAFKDKWLRQSAPSRTKRIVDNAIADLKVELYETFGL